MKLKKITTLALVATILLSSVYTPVYAEDIENIHTEIVEETVSETDIISESDNDITEPITASEDETVSDTPESTEPSDELVELTINDDTEAIETAESDDEDQLLGSSSAPCQNAAGETIISVTTRSGNTYSGDANARLDEQSTTFNPQFSMHPNNWIERDIMQKTAKEIVNAVITDDMSDLEKYWTLWQIGRSFNYGKTIPDSVNYKNSALPILLYGHRNYGWTSRNPGTCDGIAKAYMELCHAANLPCAQIYISTNGSYASDHTEAYIPNINGHDYIFADGWLCSLEAYENEESPWTIKKSQFNQIDCSDTTFDDIGLNYPTFDAWYAAVLKAHPDYVDYGSATRGVHYAKMSDRQKELMNPDLYPYVTTVECQGLILGEGESYTVDTLAVNNSPFIDLINVYADWGYDINKDNRTIKSDSEFWHNPDGHDCLTEGCISFDTDTGKITINHPISKDSTGFDSKHTWTDPNPSKCIGKYDSNKLYSCIPLVIEYSNALRITQNIYVPYDYGYEPGPDDPDPTPTPEPDPEEKNPSFKKANFTLHCGDELDTDNVIREELTSDCTLMSSDPSVASIESDGKITAHKGGYCKVLIIKSGKQISSASVTVYEPKLEGPEEASVGGTYTFTMTSELAGYDMKWASSDSSVLKFDRKDSSSGYFKALKKGTATISAQDRSGKTHSITVTVYGKPGFLVKSQTVNVGEMLKINDRIYDCSTCENVKFTVNNTSIATINGSVLTPVKMGTVTVTADADGIKSTLTVSIYNPVLTGASDLYLDGKTTTFKVTGGAGTTTWSSSDESVLTVTNKGVAKGIADGTAKVIAVNNGKTMEMSVTVHRIPRLINNSIAINLDQTLTIDDSVVDLVDIDPSKVTYTLSRTKAATLSGNELTSVATGSCSVTIQADTKKFTLKVTIVDPTLVAPDIVYLNNKTVNLKVNTGVKTTQWSVDNDDVLSITDKGVIKGISQGHAKVTAINNGRTLTKDIYVCPFPKFNVKSTDLNLDKTLPLDDALFDDSGIGGVTYKSSNIKVAVIEDGKLKPLKTGSITLTATVDKKNYTTKVNIYDPALVAPNVVYLNNRNVTLKITSGVKATEWTSSEENVLSITNKGVVKGLSKGSSTITAINNGRVLTKDIYVCPIPKFNTKTVTINTGDTLDLDNDYFDDEGIGDTTYTIGRTTAVSIDDNNIVTGIAKGRATITALCDGKKYTMTVNVFNPEISGTDTLLLDNKTATLKITNGNGPTIWSSSDPDIVSITDKGVIKGLKKGTAVITAVNNDRTMTQTISVYNVPWYEKTYITNLDTPIYVNLNKDSDMPTPVYSVNNKKVATIDASGLLTPIKTGSVTVYAVVGGKKYSTTVKIYNPTIKCSDTVRVNRTVTATITNGLGTTSWSIEGDGIATITEKGVIKGLSPGTAEIKAVNNGKTVTKTITVIP